jgi:hypothetical protein
VNRRLLGERASVECALARTKRATLERVDLDGQLYEITFRVRTLVRLGDGSVAREERNVLVSYLLLPEHPRRPPAVWVRATDLWNPHVHDVASGPPPVAALCLGRFRAHDRLGDWIVATWDVLRLARHGLDQPFCEPAAAWVRRELGIPGALPTDPRPFFEESPL